MWFLSLAYGMPMPQRYSTARRRSPGALVGVVAETALPAI